MLTIEIKNGYCCRGNYTDEYKAFLDVIRKIAINLESSGFSTLVLSSDTQVVQHSGWNNTAPSIFINIFSDNRAELDKAAEVLAEVDKNKYFYVLEKYPFAGAEEPVWPPYQKF